MTANLGPAKVRNYQFFTLYTATRQKVVKKFTSKSSASQFAQRKGWSLNTE